jgi:D-beta-D-heptose 7-phosphate kinase/D-beta-D-heptose 1-phosphate adenosyltransferase
VDLIGVVDVELARTIKYLSGSRVDMTHCVFDKALRKERIMLGDELLVRVDDADLYEFQSKSVQDELEGYLRSIDPVMIVLSDYGSGAVDEETLPLLLEHREKLLVDTKIKDLSVFGQGGRRTLLAKLNNVEWVAAQAVYHSPEESFDFLVVTHGEMGASLVMRSAPDMSGGTVCQAVVARAHPVAVADVCGCGDTFLAGLAASMLGGSDPYSAVQFANAAAATVVSQPRTAIADLNNVIGLLGMNK